MAMRRALAAASRPLHTSANARALPALADEPKRGGLLSSLFGGSAPAALPPMTEPLQGVAAPPYAAPAKAPATSQKKLANGVIIAAEDTPVREPAAPAGLAADAAAARPGRLRACAAPAPPLPAH
jgi:hypothetical protein